ncbi:BaiN/RdsA family NAD(P)/FAD-dependent oxidoreductase [Sphingobacterium griseoflavum]|uniref:DNA-binding protein n=1 Tax=Sphingobacterium griseoflavum TaxID=1474952 RepID=A0ABQ3HUP4_9SPHI|nr:aminoacetone oxidase family FAD-binding enzyme [Sphingobacterium griseoflavum]GHE36197.1 hypothetical protein GCM10017764_19460 [Sphingobacterium griseoflavum]
MEYDALVIGGGACGLMCATQAGLLGKRTLVLEKNDKVGAKILISGGGRCNYTNLHTDIENFISENPAFLRSAFAQWTVDDTMDFFKQHGQITGEEKTLGQLFPKSNKAKDIVAVFTKLMYETGQDVWLNTEVVSVSPVDDGYAVAVVKAGKQKMVHAKKVVFASGGLPVAKLGASDFAIRMAKKLGLQIVATAPALVPVTITGKDAPWYASLAGNAVFSRVYNDKIAFEENILFTHWGLSGPAILQISSYWRAGESFLINLLPTADIEQLIKKERNAGGKRTISQLLQPYFTRKMVEALGKFLPIDLKIASLSKADAKLVADTVHHFPVKPAGDKGYDKAEVMRGGVSTDELHAKNLESKKYKGLYFGGEAVDVTGWLGGYNFQWAWASGYLIAKDL